MAALLTTHGLLLVDNGDGTLGQADFRDAAARAQLARLRLSDTLPVDPFRMLVERTPPSAREAVAGWDDGPIMLHPDPADPALVLVERDGQHLAARAEGPVVWTDAPPGVGERYLVLDDAALSFIDALLANDWVIRSSRTLVRACDVVMVPGFVLRVGVLDVPVAVQDLQTPDLRAPDGAPFVLRLLRDGWRIEEIRLFRPMVFYASFRSENVHAQLFASLQSLFEFGGYEGRVHVFTELSPFAIRRALPRIAAAEALTTTTMDPVDFIGFVAAKYGIVDCEAAGHCQPLLYLDPDTVANASLLPLLIDVALSDRLVAPVETHRPRTASLGRDVIAADGGAPEEGFGVNGGTIGIPNLPTGGPTLRLIRRIIGNYLARHGRSSLPWVDQEIANYVGDKLGVLDEGSISRYVRSGTPAEPVNPGPATGIVHFWATPKDERHLVMQRYVARLRQRQRRFAPLPTAATA